METLKKEKRLWKALVKYFLQGLLYVVPIGVTLFLILWLVMKIDGIINLNIPGLGLVVILIVITIIGYLGTHVFFSYLRPFDRAIEKTPLIKLVYSSLKDLMSAFVGKKKQFKTPVLVKMGGQLELERMGFVTKQDLTHMGISIEKVAVYFPFSYGINGQVIIVPKKNVTPINASAADVMKFIVSGGVTSIDNFDS
ncbi:MAG: DUF502 domain-containing protein [Flavobacteriales bacterium]|nr:DUF502 domain-containing protein [Flavobacteriales bacterium]